MELKVIINYREKGYLVRLSHSKCYFALSWNMLKVNKGIDHHLSVFFRIELVFCCSKSFELSQKSYQKIACVHNKIATSPQLKKINKAAIKSTDNDKREQTLKSKSKRLCVNSNPSQSDRR